MDEKTRVATYCWKELKRMIDTNEIYNPKMADVAIYLITVLLEFGEEFLTGIIPKNEIKVLFTVSDYIENRL